MPNLERQQEEGWNVGNESMPLLFEGAVDHDSEGGESWRRRLWDLAERMRPASSRWAPYYAPTLFQSLQSSRGDSLRALLRPIFTVDMQRAYQQGRALAGLFSGSRGCRTDVAVVLDADGAQSVAAAAAMAFCLEPIFVFDNWPHPAGVVPSHLTLAATLYYAPLFERLRSNRPAGRAPLFVLDRRRLSLYVDEASRFDNRYVARIPAAGALAASGIRHLLYVTDAVNTHRELDDLNEDFVSLARAGIDVRMVALQAFVPKSGDEVSVVQGLASLGNEEESSSEPSALIFGGATSLQARFWSWYGWPDSNGQLMTFSAADETSPIPAYLLAAWSYRPIERATMFSDQGWAGQGTSSTGFFFTGSMHGGGMRSGTLGRLGGGHGFG